MSGLQFKIAADVSNAVENISKLEKQVASFGGGVSKSIGPAEQAFKKLASAINSVPQSAISKLEKQVSSFGGGVNRYIPPSVEMINKFKESLIKVPNASNQAANSLMNLSRVVQDAPYGFIGIANNLNPLLESFQRLRATTGSTGGALKALGSSLTGAGGIGLALGVVSSLLITFGDSIFGAKNRVEGFNFELNDLTEQANRSKEAIQALGDRLDYLQKIGNITVDLNFAGDNERARLKAQIESVKADEQLQGLQVEAKKLGEAFDKTWNLFSDGASRSTLQLIARFPSIYDIPEGAIERLGKRDKEFVESLKKNRESIKDLQEKIEQTEQSRTIARASIRLTITEQERKATEEALKKSKQAYEEYISSTIARAKKLSEVMKGVINLQFKEGLFDTKAQLFEKAISFLSDFKNGKFELIIPARVRIEDVEFPPPPIEDIRDDSKRLADMFGKEYTSYIKDLPVGTADLSLVLAVQNSGAAKTAAQLLGEYTAKAFNDGFASTLNDSVTGIGQVLGEAFSGGDIKAAFAQFGSAIGSGLQTIGKQIIAIGTAALLAKQALKKLFTNPAIAIAAGVALVAAGTAFKSLLSKGLSGRAAGGPVAANQPYVVGEIGREIFVPSTSGRIIPNNQLGRISGQAKQMIEVFVTGRISGNDLVLAQARQNRYNDRNV